MIYYKHGQYHLPTLKVHYEDDSEGEVAKFVGQEGKEWWENFAEKWTETFELIEFIEIDDYTQGQYERLDKVNELELPEGVPFVEEYVLEGKFEKEIEDGEIVKINRSNPLYILKLEQDNEEMGEAVFELMNEQYNADMENKEAIFELMNLL